MKIFLSLVVVVLAVLCGWIRYTSTRPTESHRAVIAGLKVELKESHAELDAANEDLDKAKAEIETLKRRLASLEEAAVDRAFSGKREDATVRSAEGVITLPAGSQSGTKTPSAGWTHESRLSALKATFDSHRLGIENRKDLLESDLATLRAKRKSVESTELNFSEQSTRVDLDGNVLGNRGVRTSAADRDRAKAKVADQVAEVDLEIARKQAEIKRLTGELESLRNNYSRALVRANEEFGVSGSRATGD